MTQALIDDGDEETSRCVRAGGAARPRSECAGTASEPRHVEFAQLFQGVNNVIDFHRIVGPRLMGLAPDEAAIAEAMPKAHVVFSELSRLLGSKTYIAEEEVTLADMLVAPQLDFLAETPEWEPLTAASSNLVRLQRMNARASFKATTWERVAELAKAA